MNSEFQLSVSFENLVKPIMDFFMKRIISSPHLILTRSLAKISQEAREPEGLVEITYGTYCRFFLKEREIQIRKNF